MAAFTRAGIDGMVRTPRFLSIIHMTIYAITPEQAAEWVQSAVEDQWDLFVESADAMLDSEALLMFASYAKLSRQVEMNLPSEGVEVIGAINGTLDIGEHLGILKDFRDNEEYYEMVVTARAWVMQQLLPHLRAYQEQHGIEDPMFRGFGDQIQRGIDERAQKAGGGVFYTHPGPTD